MASQSACTGVDGNQVHTLRSPVPSIRGAVNRHPSPRVFGSPVVLDNDRSRKQAARFQDLLQRPSHAYLTGRANAGYARVTTNRKSPLVWMAAPLSILISDPNGCLTFQIFGLTVASGQACKKPRMKSCGVCALGCSTFRGSDRFTVTKSVQKGRGICLSRRDLPVISALVAIRQTQVNGGVDGWIVAGPPECLGFTPYCGLWDLIEAEPSDPSNKILLQNIRSNL